MGGGVGRASESRRKARLRRRPVASSSGGGQSSRPAEALVLASWGRVSSSEGGHSPPGTWPSACRLCGRAQRARASGRTRLAGRREEAREGRGQGELSLRGFPLRACMFGAGPGGCAHAARPLPAALLAANGCMGLPLSRPLLEPAPSGLTLDDNAVVTQLAGAQVEHALPQQRLQAGLVHGKGPGLELGAVPACLRVCVWKEAGMHASVGRSVGRPPHVRLARPALPSRNQTPTPTQP